MYLPEATGDYLKIIQADPVRYAEDFRDILADSKEQRRLYHGAVIPMTYQGLFLDDETVDVYADIIEMMARIGRKVTAEYVRNPAYREGFRFDETTEALILIDPGYDEPVPIGRYDIFYNGGRDFKFCELNTDGASAMNEDRVIGGLLMNSASFRELGKDWHIEQFELFDSLVQAFLSRYAKITDEQARTVAIVDFMDKGTTIEFEVFRKAFERSGVDCLICEPNAMRYERGRLIGRDVDSGREAAIDLVYRRVVTGDFVERIGECGDFLQAYRDRAFVMMGSFRSQVMHSKLIFDMLYDSQTKRILSEEENAFVAAHVPVTHKLITEADYARVIDCKDDFILKPYNSYASHGILLGREHDPAQWRALVEALPADEYIYQSYVDVEKTPFVELIDGEFQTNRLGHVIGLFMYDGQFSGVYTRVGAHGIISGARDYYSMPVFRVRRK